MQRCSSCNDTIQNAMYFGAMEQSIKTIIYIVSTVAIMYMLIFELKCPIMDNYRVLLKEIVDRINRVRMA